MEGLRGPLTLGWHTRSARAGTRRPQEGGRGQGGRLTSCSRYSFRMRCSSSSRPRPRRSGSFLCRSSRSSEAASRQFSWDRCCSSCEQEAVAEAVSGTPPPRALMSQAATRPHSPTRVRCALPQFSPLGALPRVLGLGCTHPSLWETVPGSSGLGPWAGWAARTGAGSPPRRGRAVLSAWRRPG